MFFVSFFQAPNVGVQPRPKAVGWNNGLGVTGDAIASEQPSRE
jgi:hypothetical protein